MTLPTGTVTFLFTDMEGSTRLVQEIGQTMYEEVLSRYLKLQRDAVAANGGVEVDSAGDGLFLAFERPTDALKAAVEAQCSLEAADWPGEYRLRARMGMHAGEASVVDGTYVGLAVHLAARVADAGHGGQILLTSSTRELLGDVPAGVDLRGMGAHRLKDIIDPVPVVQAVHPSLDDAFPALRTLSDLPNNIPVRRTSFIGRDRFVDEVIDLLVDQPIVTLLGVGGVGKTSVALKVAEETLPAYPDGAWFCEFGPLTDEGAVVHSVASLLQVQQGADRSPTQAIVDALRTKRVLLVFDNCEHLLRPVAELTEALTSRCPDVRILATSREGLAVDGEQCRPVPSLAVPRPDMPMDELRRIDTVALFCDRASAVRPEFVLDAQTAPDVIEICRRLDGVPLAVELAAARVRSMSPADVASRLGERFRLLKGGRRTAVERHQTLRSTVDWSYDLLDPRERLLFQRLAVFAGGFTLQTAEAVCADDEVDELDVDDLVASLVEKSMVVPLGERFVMLETLRSYGLEKLEDSGRADEQRRRYATYFVARAEETLVGSRGPEEARFIDEAALEWDNFRASHQWTVDVGDVELSCRIAGGMYVYTYDRLNLEQVSWAEVTAAMPGAREHPLYPQVAGSAAMGLTQSGRHERAIELAEDALAASQPDDPLRAIPLSALFLVALYRGRLDECRALCAESVALTEAAGDHYLTAYGCMVWALAAGYAGDMEEAESCLERQLAHAEATGSPRSRAWGAYLRGEILVESDPLRALPYLEAAIEEAEGTKNWFLEGVTRVSIASVRGRHGDVREAFETFEEIIESWHRAGNWQHQLTALRNLVELLERAGMASAAVTLYGATESAEFGSAVFGAHAERLDALAERTRGSLGAETYREAFAYGAALDADEAVAFALEQIRTYLEGN